MTKVNLPQLNLAVYPHLPEVVVYFARFNSTKVQ
jgi:hypothetical protein